MSPWLERTIALGWSFRAHSFSVTPWFIDKRLVRRKRSALIFIDMPQYNSIMNALYYCPILLALLWYFIFAVPIKETGFSVDIWFILKTAWENLWCSPAYINYWSKYIILDTISQHNMNVGNWKISRRTKCSSLCKIIFCGA